MRLALSERATWCGAETPGSLSIYRGEVAAE